MKHTDRQFSAISISIVALFATIGIGIATYWIIIKPYNAIDNIASRFEITFPTEINILENKQEDSFHGDGYRYIRISVKDKEKTNDTILEDDLYISNQLDASDKKIISETKELFNLHLDLNNLYEKPSLTIINGNGTLIIIHEKPSNEYHLFESLT